MDYLIVVVAFNRGIRRVVDYYSGHFDPYSPISLTPLIVGGLAALVVLQYMQSNNRGLGPTTRKVLQWYLIACGLALAVGLYRNRLGAIYELGSYLAPVGMIGFGAMYGRSPRIMWRWGVSAVLTGFGVAAYGLYQFYTIPPWDAFWVKAVGFVGYLGILEPTKMTLFSTMNERGPAGVFLAATLILILLRRSLLGPIQYVLGIVVAVALLFTYVRSSLIQVVLTCVAIPVVTKGKGLVGLALIAVVLALFGESLLGFLPNGDQVSNRINSLRNVQDDTSFKARIWLLQAAARQAATNPMGLGLGSQGQAGRVTNTRAAGIIDSTGYMQILTTFGVIGTVLIVAVLRQLWLSSSYVWKRNPTDPDTVLFRAWFVSGMVVLFTGNWLADVSYFWLLAGYVVGCEDEIRACIQRSSRMASPSSPKPYLT